MPATRAGKPRQRLLPNLLLGLSTTAMVAGGLEGLARLVERGRPPSPPVADYIWDWQQKWDGDFYTMRSEAVGWPPWEEYNEDGVRDRTHAVEKPDGVARVLCLGDSVTLGHGLRPEQTFPQLLQQRLDECGPGVEVFNLALWGWSTRQERIAYRRIGRKYRPDQVLLGLCLNDVAELQNNLARPPRWLSLLHRRSALVRRVVDAPGREIRSVEQMLREPGSGGVREGFERLFAELRALRDEVRADGAALSVLVFPFRFQLEAGAPPPTAQQRILGFCASSEIPAVDLLPELRGVGRDAFHDYDHLSLTGAQRVAEALIRTGVVRQTLPAAEVLAEALRPESGTASRLPAGTTVPPASSAREVALALRHPDPRVRRAGAWALARAGAAPAVPDLAAALRDPEEAVRAEAARALAQAGRPGRAALPALFEALSDPRQRVRWEAARALWRLRPPAPLAVEPMARALRSHDRYVRGFAAWRLGEIGPAARAAVPALVGALGHDEAFGRAGAALALARIGAAAREAVPALLVGLGDPDAERRWRAARALGRIGFAGDGAMPALIVALADPDERVRAHAARALGRIGPGTSAAAEALARATADPAEGVRTEAREALRRLSS